MTMRSNCRLPIAIVWGLSLAALPGGFASPPSKFRIRDFRAPVPTGTYTEVFEEGFYRLGPGGNLDLVFQRVTPSAEVPAEEVRQIIHIHAFWRSYPGRTVAEPTQINATVTYAITMGRVGATFEGAGSLFFGWSTWNRDVVTGALDLATLRPVRKRGRGAELFRRARLSGRFRAERDSRRTLRLMHEIDRLMGPMPPPGR